MTFEWDANKAEANFRKHGIRFAEAIPAFEDDFAITVEDDGFDPGELRFVTIGIGEKNRILVVVYCYREENIRIISVRLAEAWERRQYEENR